MPSLDDVRRLALARLDTISTDRLEELVTSAWLERAPERLAREHGF